MDIATTPLARPNPTDPTKDRPGQTVSAKTIPQNLAALLQLVQILFGYGRHLAELTASAAHHANSRFTTVAAVCGTHDLVLIAARIQRGLLRLLALENYLRKRAEKGRDIAHAEPRGRVPVAQTETPADPEKSPRARRPAYEPDSATIPTLAEMEAEVRRAGIGRTITRVCLDLGIVPGFCTGEVWSAIDATLRYRGGSLRKLYTVRAKRQENFLRERDRHPETWDWVWHDLRKTTVRQVLGWLIGETPSHDPPECLAALA